MFRRPSIRYGQTPEPVTPYQRAAQAWDDRIGSARVQARNWRLAFFGTLALSGALTAGIIWQGARGSIVPWVVEVDKLGEAQAIAPATADWQPSDPQIAFHLARFIEQRSDEHTSELQSLLRTSYAVFGMKKTTRDNSSTT